MEDKKDIIVEADEIQVNSSNVGPLAQTIYTMKAFQSSYQPETITWDSVGDKVNYNANGAITSDKWVRQGIYLCSSDQLGGPAFFLTDYDGFYDIKETYGSMFFKAVMCKLEIKTVVPPYSTFLSIMNIDRAIYKKGDGDSSAWMGMASGEWDKCNTISENNCEVSGGWVGAPIEEGYYSYMDRAYHIDIARPCVYKTWSVDNMFSQKEVRASIKPMYLMNMMELPQKHATYMGYVDKFHPSRKEFSNHFTAYLWYDDDYDDNGFVDNDAARFDENEATRSELISPERTGYIMRGWLDPLINVIYPAGGAYRQRRGARLQGQWIEDVVPYTVAHYHADGKGNYSCSSETFYYMAGGMVCPQPEQNAAYKTPEPITACVAGDGSTVIAYYYEIAEYPVQYSANGGEFEDGTDYVESSLSYGEKIPENSLFAYRQGYTFDKWEPQLPQKMPCGAVTTRIVWTANNYTVKYDKNDANATGEMEPQGFVYDQPQKLRKNTYECQHTIKYEIVTPTGDKISFEQNVKCGFVGWATEKDGAKVYNDEELVCNLTTEVDGQVHLRALWEPASIQLPQFDYEGYYLDAWYEDETCEGTPIKPGSEYKPKEDVTLCGKLICTKVENLKWDMEPVEPVDERPIRATWKAVEGATAYRVGLEDTVQKINVPFYEEDFSVDNVKYIDADAVEVTETELDFTETFKRFTAGGTFKFSVVPVFENIPQGKIKGTFGPAIMTLARVKNLEWDETRTVAMWDCVEGADYYLMWLYSGETDKFEDAAGMTAADASGFEQYRDSRNCVIVWDAKADLSSAMGFVTSVQYEVAGYSKKEEEYYTPLYERIRSEEN